MASNFEVYYGEKGLWTRVVLYGNDGGENTTLKGGTDLLRLSVLETSFVTAILKKISSDFVTVSILENSSLNATGVTEILKTDIIRPVIVENRAIFVSLSAVDTVVPTLAESNIIGIDKTGSDSLVIISTEEVSSLIKTDSVGGSVTSAVEANV